MEKYVVDTCVAAKIFIDKQYSLLLMKDISEKYKKAKNYQIPSSF